MTCGTPANTAPTAATSNSWPPPNGYPLWTSPVTPGCLHDITAAREHCLGALFPTNIPILTDKAYPGAGIGIHAPVRKPWGGQTTLHVDNTSVCSNAD